MRRIAIFAHYDAQDRVRPYIVHHLRALRELCDEIVFVTTSRPPPEELARVTPWCARTLQKENLGYDFGMWRLALEEVALERWDELVLTNSSVFGPLVPLGRVFDRMAERRCDVWGMTDNVEIAWHLQSYFLVFRKRVLDSDAFRLFWSSVLPYRDKRQVIRSYEVGLSRFLIEQGFVLEAFVRLAVVRELHRLPLLEGVPLLRRFAFQRAPLRDPTLVFASDLVREGMPFVKVALLRDNPLERPLEPVLEAIRQSGFDLGLIPFDRPLREGELLPELQRPARHL